MILFLKYKTKKSKSFYTLLLLPYLFCDKKNINKTCSNETKGTKCYMVVCEI